MDNQEHYMTEQSKQAEVGYYLVTIGSEIGGKFLRSNDERAFIISQLQSLLHFRSILEEPNPHKRLASHIDLLAFSLLPSDIRLIAFTISKKSLSFLSRTLVERLRQYQTEQSLTNKAHIEPTIVTVSLAGPHHALMQTAALHLRHLDWEYDRYSSIGFFLHDRRGSWMRLWRLASLFDSDSHLYRQLLTTYTAKRLTTARPLDSSQHE